VSLAPLVFSSHSIIMYLNGTTDVTRNFHMGTASAHHKRCYTRVLQAHLQLQNVVFPKGITGTHFSRDFST
jgi:Xaa-Pro aminopeptidase